MIYQGDISPLHITPTFDHGYLIVWERNTDADMNLKRIGVYGPGGALAYHATIQLPNQKHLRLLNGAADTDDTVAVAFDNPGGFAVLDPSGKQIRTVVTGLYVPEQICFAPDHTIWVAGQARPEQDYKIFRKYTPDGQELGEFLPKSTFRPSLVSVRTVGGRALSASADRIVSLLRSDAPGPAPLEWVELNFDGKLIGRPGQHRYFFPWALTPDGTIYAREGGDKFVFFDRAGAGWKPVPVTPQGSLAGADRNGLVFQLPNTTTFAWVPLP
ncbi:MAG: hypothetical protein P4L56_21220 [Candidatus Sulfopaludibacter sp.]|nr:hypothetical protein [Candidatus Sulfopaludibacter sp.]